MTVNTIHSKINLLPQERLGELLNFVEFLLNKDLSAERQTVQRRKPKFGSGKGIFKMSADFDEPLDDFNEYMP